MLLSQLKKGDTARFMKGGSPFCVIDKVPKRPAIINNKISIIYPNSVSIYSPCDMSITLIRLDLEDPEVIKCF